MCETPKKPNSVESDAKKLEKHSYYYDDSHGYEDYDPDESEDDDPYGKVDGSVRNTS